MGLLTVQLLERARSSRQAAMWLRRRMSIGSTRVARPVEIGISGRFTGAWARPKLRRRWGRNTVVMAMLGTLRRRVYN